jgi:hypothetical protein
MPFAFDPAAGAPPGAIERPAEAALIEAPNIVAFDSEIKTSGTPPVTAIAPVDWIASDLTTMRFTVLPSGCVAGSMGLEKQSCSGAVASVRMVQDPDWFSSCAIADAWEISARLIFDGWKGNAVVPPSIGLEPEGEGEEPQAVKRANPPVTSPRACLALDEVLLEPAPCCVSVDSSMQAALIVPSFQSSPYIAPIFDHYVIGRLLDSFFPLPPRCSLSADRSTLVSGSIDIGSRSTG